MSAEKAVVEPTWIAPKQVVTAETATVALSGEPNVGEILVKKLPNGAALSRESVQKVRPPVISVPIKVGNVARNSTAVRPRAPEVLPVACL